jgi:hypothetical protein
MTSPELSAYFQLLSHKGHRAIKQKRAAGETMHLAPLGYRNVRKAGRSVIEPDPTTIGLVSEARLLRHQGHSIRAICRIMASRGLRSSRGKRIGPSSMLKILSGC